MPPRDRRGDDEDRRRFQEERRREAEVRRKLDASAARALTDWLANGIVQMDDAVPFTAGIRFSRRVHHHEDSRACELNPASSAVHPPRDGFVDAALNTGETNDIGFYKAQPRGHKSTGEVCDCGCHDGAPLRHCIPCCEPPYEEETT